MEVRPGQTPAHSQPLIPYTTTRDAINWRFRSSAQWREMPSEFGPWPTVYGRLSRLAGRRGFLSSPGRPDRRGRPPGTDGLIPGQRGLHHCPRPPRRSRDAHRQGRHGRP
ncbi:transposase [Streptomyces chartreusis]